MPVVFCSCFSPISKTRTVQHIWKSSALFYLEDQWNAFDLHIFCSTQRYATENLGNNEMNGEALARQAIVVVPASNRLPFDWNTLWNMFNWHLSGNMLLILFYHMNHMIFLFKKWMCLIFCGTVESSWKRVEACYFVGMNLRILLKKGSPHLNIEKDQRHYNEGFLLKILDDISTRT